MITIDPLDCYWSIASTPNKVFSSSRMAFVPVNDGAYVTWRNAIGGDRTARIDNATNLYAVLAEHVLPLLLAKGIELISLSMPSLNGTYSLSQQAQNYITGIATGIASGKGLPGGGQTFYYNGVVFTSDQFLSVATALETHVYNLNLGLGTYLASGGQAGSLPETPVVIA